MAKRHKDMAEILADILRGSEVDFADSSDSDGSSSEEERVLHTDPAYDQEEDNGFSGFSGFSYPPFEASPPRSRYREGNEDEDEDVDYSPPPHSSTRRRTTSSSSGSSSPERPTNNKATKRGRGRGRRGQASKRPKLAAAVFDPRERWRTKEEPDVEPPTPPFEPKQPPGPRIDTTADWSPLSLFKLFFSSSTLHTIISNTNANAVRQLAQGSKYRWTHLTVDTFYIFLSIVLFFGLVHVRSRADFWRKEWPYQFAFPKSSMPRDQFEAIFWSLHLCDVKEDEENEKKRGTPQFDRLFKIKPLHDEIVSACNSHFQPYQNITINQRMVARQARDGFRQHMKDKPTKFGYKMFVLTDSKTGYTSNFFVYEGKDRNQVKLSGQKDDDSVTAVMDLMRFDLLGKGYRLYVNDFYTSPRLFSMLLENDTAACGTIRTNREGFPWTTNDDLPKKPERGDMRWIRKGNLLFARWMDTKVVNVCSTFHKAFSGATVLRRVKRPDGQWHKAPVDVPDACRDYNVNMGGVDLADALIQYYSVQGKTMRWYKRFFYHFIDIAVVNSYILHKAVASSHNQTPMSHKQFREVLMREMVSQAKAVVAEASPRPSLSNACMPVFRGSTATQDRRKCVICADKEKEKARQMPGYKAKYMKTPVYCSRCNVSLCLVPDRNCFLEYHALILEK